LGLAPPETIDDWEEALIGFRDEFGAVAPFTYMWWQRGFCPVAAAYGIRTGHYPYINDAGQVSFGFMEDAAFDYLVRMNRWFEEGLLDPDFGSVNSADVFVARLTDGSSGAALGNIGAAIGVLMNTMEDDPTYDLVPLPMPVQQRGQTPRLGHMDNAFPGGHSAAITTSASNVEVAARLLDFGYSAEGHQLFNFGLYGRDFTMVDGVPTYTEAITNHPDGWPLAQAIASVGQASYGGTFMQSYHYVWQFFPLQRQRDALATWMAADSARFIMPPVTPSSDEADRLAMLMGEISTYIDEMHLRFIFGEEEMSRENFDRFRDTLRTLGIDEVLEIQTAAHQRFLQR